MTMASSGSPGSTAARQPSGPRSTCSRGAPIASSSDMPSRMKFRITCSSAVVMRSAPGLPRASMAPFSARATVGDMFDAMRWPVGSA
jgi:hypothetical protein